MALDLDHYLSAAIRARIEERYYAPVNAQSRFEELLRDPAFLQNNGKHVGLFADHGVVHVRDVAHKLLGVLDTVHGLLIPKRPWPRLSLMRGYGVLVAYLHDIGMSDFSAFGRVMHPEFAAQAVFRPDLEDVIQAMWEENSGNVAWHLLNLSNQGLLRPAPQLVFREMLALSLAHSKSKVPVAVLNNPAQLRTYAIEVITTDLPVLFDQQQAGVAGARGNATYRQNEFVRPYYQEPDREAFQWLISLQPELQSLTQDVTDTLRALRCADALRQRGTVLETSGGYEIFVNQHSGHAVFALRLGDSQLYLLELEDVISAGEAIIASSELDPAGDLRISFTRGAFSNPGATSWAARSAAVVVHDIQRDVSESFRGPEPVGLKASGDMKILLEEVDDNPDFAQRVRTQLIDLDPAAGRQAQVVPSLQQASDLERERYRAGAIFDWERPRRLELLAHMRQSGHRVEAIDPDLAFEGVRLITIHGDEVLIQAGTPSAFVYIPFDSGLKIMPLGGYHPFSVQSWMPLGMTGVIRGAVRNATVVAEQTVRLLVIPKTVYLKYWHHTHSWQSLREATAFNEPPPSIE